MNQVSKNPREENNLNRAFWKHDRRINLAKKEIQIFLNASERIKDMGLDKVSVEYLQVFAYKNWKGKTMANNHAFTQLQSFILTMDRVKRNLETFAQAMALR